MSLAFQFMLFPSGISLPIKVSDSNINTIIGLNASNNAFSRFPHMLDAATESVEGKTI